MQVLYLLSMNRTLYSALGYLLLPIMVLRLLLKSIKTRSYRQRILERLGLINKIPVPIIWLHCVSVGEFRASIVLIDQLIKQYPNYRILVTTTTPTGAQALKEHYQNEVLHYYFPFDLPLIVNHYIKQINPAICLLLETEIWPNLIHALNKNNIPSLLINARLSERSLEKYQKFAPKLAKQTLNKFHTIATQNKNSSKRFIQLGAHESRVLSAGNIKFDQNIFVDPLISNTLRKITKNRQVIAFASTHKGEEIKIINALQKHSIDAIALIIPRHPERFDEVYELAKQNKLTVVRRSHNRTCEYCQVLLGDSMGEMMTYYQLADIVFMGGSLNNTGGHNMLEPASLAKPILFGPNVFNFAEISNDLLQKNASIQVKDEFELLLQIKHLLENPKAAQDLGTQAQQYFKSQQGALDILMQKIQSIL